MEGSVGFPQLPFELWADIVVRSSATREISALSRVSRLLFSVTDDDSTKSRWLIRRHGKGGSFSFLLFRLPRMLVASFRHHQKTPAGLAAPPVVKNLLERGCVIRRGDIQLCLKTLSVGRGYGQNLEPSTGWGAFTWSRPGADLLDEDVSDYAYQLLGLAKAQFGTGGAALSRTDLLDFCSILGYDANDRNRIAPRWPPQRLAEPGWHREWQLAEDDAVKLRRLVFDFNLGLRRFGTHELPSTDPKLAWLVWDLAVSEYACFQHLLISGSLDLDLALVWSVAMRDIPGLYRNDWTLIEMSALTSNILSRHHEDTLGAIFQQREAQLADQVVWVSMARFAAVSLQRSDVEYAARDLVSRLRSKHPLGAEAVSLLLAEAAWTDDFKELLPIAASTALFAIYSGHENLETILFETIMDRLSLELVDCLPGSIARVVCFPFKFALQRLFPRILLSYENEPIGLEQPVEGPMPARKTIALIFQLLNRLVQPCEELHLFGPDQIALPFLKSCESTSAELAPLPPQRAFLVGGFKMFLASSFRAGSALALIGEQVVILERVKGEIERSEKIVRVLLELSEELEERDGEEGLDGMRSLFGERELEDETVNFVWHRLLQQGLVDEGQKTFTLLSGSALNFLKAMSQAYEESRETFSGRYLGKTADRTGMDVFDDGDEAILDNLF